MSRLVPAILPAFVLLAACNSGDDSGSRGATNSIPENSGMQAGTGVGDNAPAGSSAPDAQGGGDGTQTGNPAGAMNYPATGTQ